MRLKIIRFVIFSTSWESLSPYYLTHEIILVRIVVIERYVKERRLNNAATAVRTYDEVFAERVASEGGFAVIENRVEFSVRHKGYLGPSV
jgi:hypothetical protein